MTTICLHGSAHWDIIGVSLSKHHTYELVENKHGWTHWSFLIKGVACTIRACGMVPWSLAYLLALPISRAAWVYTSCWWLCGMFIHSCMLAPDKSVCSDLYRSCNSGKHFWGDVQFCYYNIDKFVQTICKICIYSQSPILSSGSTHSCPACDYYDGCSVLL